MGIARFRYTCESQKPLLGSRIAPYQRIFSHFRLSCDARHRYAWATQFNSLTIQLSLSTFIKSTDVSYHIIHPSSISSGMMIDFHLQDKTNANQNVLQLPPVGKRNSKAHQKASNGTSSQLATPTRAVVEKLDRFWRQHVSTILGL